MDRKTTTSVALIGCGNIGSLFDENSSRDLDNSLTHAAAITKNPTLDLIAVADNNETRAHECAQYWKVPHVFSSAQELIRSVNLDLLVIASPPADRYELIELAINHGIHSFFLEKPFATNSKTAKKLLSLIKGHNVICGVNYLRRWSLMPSVLTREIQKMGGIDKIQRIHCLYGKGIINNGSHIIDMLNLLLGTPSKGLIHPSPFKDDESYPSPDVSLTYGTDIPCTIHSTNYKDFSLFEIDIIHRNGRLKISNGGDLIEVYHKQEHATYKGYHHLQFHQKIDHCLHGALDNAYHDIHRAMSTGKQLLCTADNGYEALNTLAALSSSHSSYNQ